jgi:hypothetical protein
MGFCDVPVPYRDAAQHGGVVAPPRAVAGPPVARAALGGEAQCGLHDGLPILECGVQCAQSRIDAKVDDRGVVLLFGAKETPTPFSWTSLEGAVDFLRGKGWVTIGGSMTPARRPERSTAT